MRAGRRAQHYFYLQVYFEHVHQSFRIRTARIKNMNLPSNDYGKRLTLFLSYTAPDLCRFSRIVFHRFSDLPSEIQFKTIQYCGGATVFRFMQTGNSIRTEAERMRCPYQKTVMLSCLHAHRALLSFSV